MLQVTNIRVRSFDLDYLDVFWDVEPTYEDILDYSFTVEKSNAEFGPFHKLAGPFRDKYRLRDNTLRGQHSFYRKYYYRVKVEHIPTGETRIFPIEGNGVALSALPDLFALEMARNERLALKEHKGRQVVLYPRKTFGQRCSCYDQVTQRKMRSGCVSCFDTGWVGGYDTPLEVYAQIQTTQEITTKHVLSEIEVENTVGKFSNYPELEEGWIIVEPENIRWRVGSTIEKFKKSRAIVRQEVSLHRIPKGDIEYSLPINISDTENILATPERNYTNPHDLTSAAPTSIDLWTANISSVGSIPNDEDEDVEDNGDGGNVVIEVAPCLGVIIAATLASTGPGAGIVPLQRTYSDLLGNLTVVDYTYKADEWTVDTKTITPDDGDAVTYKAEYAASGIRSHWTVI